MESKKVFFCGSNENIAYKVGPGSSYKWDITL